MQQAVETKQSPLERQLPVAVPIQAGNIITPPDQPKSNPALAADPVPGFSPSSTAARARPCPPSATP